MGTFSDAFKSAMNQRLGNPRTQKYEDYYELVTNLLDENERNGTIFQEGTKRAVDLLGRLLGNAELSGHPYFSMHKVHFEVLASALNTSKMHSDAQNAAAAAGKVAQHAQHAEKSTDAYSTRRAKLIAEFGLFISDGLDQIQEMARTGKVEGRATGGKMSPEESVAVMEEAGVTMQELIAWLGRWDKLVRDSFSLLVMVRTEAALVRKLLDVYRKKVEAIEAKQTTIGTIASKSLYQERQFDELMAYKAGAKLDNNNSEERRALVALGRPRQTVDAILQEAEREARNTAACAAIAVSELVLKNPAKAHQAMEAAHKRG